MKSTTPRLLLVFVGVRVVRVEELGDAEIRYLHGAVGGLEEVFGLEVAVDERRWRGGN